MEEIAYFPQSDSFFAVHLSTTYAAAAGLREIKFEGEAIFFQISKLLNFLRNIKTDAVELDMQYSQFESGLHVAKITIKCGKASYITNSEAKQNINLTKLITSENIAKSIIVDSTELSSAIEVPLRNKFSTIDMVFDNSLKIIAVDNDSNESYEYELAGEVSGNGSFTVTMKTDIIANAVSAMRGKLTLQILQNQPLLLSSEEDGLWKRIIIAPIKK